MASVTLIDISSGHTYTINSLTTNVTIANWNSNNNNPKTLNIPAAGISNNGCKIEIADSAGTAGDYPITPIAASGSISPGAVISSPGGCLVLRSDGNNANWMIVGRG